MPPCYVWILRCIQRFVICLAGNSDSPKSINHWEHRAGQRAQEFNQTFINAATRGCLTNDCCRNAPARQPLPTLPRHDLPLVQTATHPDIANRIEHAHGRDESMEMNMLHICVPRSEPARPGAVVIVDALWQSDRCTTGVCDTRPAARQCRDPRTRNRVAGLHGRIGFGSADVFDGLGKPVFVAGLSGGDDDASPRVHDAARAFGLAPGIGKGAGFARASVADR